MKKLLLVLFFILSFDCSFVQAGIDSESKVWICTSSGAYAYHSKRTCRGLNNCKTDIVLVTKQEAIEKFRRKPCKICYCI